jgi:hypothetical protein
MFLTKEVQRMRLVRHVAHRREKMNVLGALVREPKGKKPRGRTRRRWEDVIKTDLKEKERDAVKGINLFEDKENWPVGLLNIPFDKIREIS